MLVKNLSMRSKYNDREFSWEKKSFTLHSKRFLKTEENEMRNYFHKTIIAWE